MTTFKDINVDFEETDGEGDEVILSREDLEAFNDAVEQNAELHDELRQEYEARGERIDELEEQLTDIQAEFAPKLAETVEFMDAEDIMERFDALEVVERAIPLFDRAEGEHPLDEELEDDEADEQGRFSEDKPPKAETGPENDDDAATKEFLENYVTGISFGDN